ncbi:hypothetical protein M0R04_09530 [Candidatus Dojkabacteria bacterium]|jgi:hypothetical protein|nr:hypothetical protein [Candidatus Dojkabacteria bacterium]
MAVIESAISGGLGLVGSIIGAGAAGDAADAQMAAARESIAFQKEQSKIAREDLAPWRKSGETALNVLTQKTLAGPGQFTKSPGYQFRLDENQKAIERNRAARGGIGGGAMSKALQRYGQDYASGEYQNFLNQYYASLNPYQNLSNTGQASAARQAATSTQLGQNVGNTMVGAGNAQAAGYINQANAITSGIGSGINNYLNWKSLQQAAVTPATTIPTANPAAPVIMGN